jgi:hypothetical protein
MALDMSTEISRESFQQYEEKLYISHFVLCLTGKRSLHMASMHQVHGASTDPPASIGTISIFVICMFLFRLLLGYQICKVEHHTIILIVLLEDQNLETIYVA